MMDLSKSYEFFNPNKDKSRIHIIGCGSVGSTVAENLARAGVTKFTLWDFDKVEAHNVVNQMFTQEDVGRNKTDALLDILVKINPDIKNDVVIKDKGWNNDPLSGYVFLCADDMKVRQNIVDMNFDNPYIKAVFDFRTRLTDAQHFAADWSDQNAKKSMRVSMDFSNEESDEATPMSACHVALSVAPTIRIISAYGVSNFMNFVNGNGIKNCILMDAFNFTTTVL